MPRPQPSLGRYLAASLFATAIACRNVAFAWAAGGTMAVSQEIDWLYGAASTYVGTMPTRVAGRYWLKVIWHLPPTLREREIRRFAESKVAGDMVAAFVEGLRRYAQRAA
jgi:hypothetical protein